MADQITDDSIFPYEISQVIRNRILQLEAGAPTFLTPSELDVCVSEIADSSTINPDDLMDRGDGMVYIRLTRSTDIAIREYNLGKSNLTVIRQITPTVSEEIPVNSLDRPKLEYLKY